MLTEGALRAWLWCPSQLLDAQGRKRWVAHDRNDDTVEAVADALVTGESNRRVLARDHYGRGVRAESYKTDPDKQDFWAPCEAGDELVLLTFRTAVRTRSYDPLRDQIKATTTVQRVRRKRPFGPAEADLERSSRAILLAAFQEFLPNDRLVAESVYPDGDPEVTVGIPADDIHAMARTVASIVAILRDEEEPEVRSWRCRSCSWVACPCRVDPDAKIIAPRGIPEVGQW